MERFSEGSTVLDNSQEHPDLVAQLQKMQTAEAQRRAIRLSSLAALASEGLVATPEALRTEIARQTAEMPALVISGE